VQANCAWILASSGASPITITFSQFSTEANYDFVTVYQCTSVECTSTTVLATLTGTYFTAQTATSASGYMLVTFTSDYILNREGFTASWTSRIRVSCVAIDIAIIFTPLCIYIYIYTHTIEYMHACMHI
jgi:hypothetical protein